MLEIKENIIFDSSNFNLDAEISKEGYLDFLFKSFQKISRERFPNDLIKQKVHKHHGRITSSCPYCGDSMQTSWKQRGNIILDGKWANYYKCFNCNKFIRIDHFLKDFNIDLKLDVLNYISQNKGDFKSSISSKYDISLLLDLEIIENFAVDRQELKTTFHLIEMKESPVWSWLNRRLQFNDKKFLYNPSKNYLLILNLTPSGKILGFQKRPFQTYSGSSRYLTYSLPGIYELMKREEKVPDEIDTLSQLFDICLLNFNRPITVFEGPMDSFLFPNAIANGGANKNFPIDIPRRYFYDDDETGRNNALKRIEEGYPIFLWERLKNEYGLPFKPKNGKKWDLNDLMIWLKEQGIPVPLWDRYFSSDPMDSIDL